MPMSHKHQKKQSKQPAADETQTTHKQLPLELSEKLGKNVTLEAVFEHYRGWLPKYRELSQGRSNFQIEKMVATEHATPGASYQHTLFQLRVLHQALLDDFIRGIERTREFEYKWKDKPHDEPQWWEVERGGKKLCWYDTDQMRFEHEMEELKMSVKDKLLQMETFTKVLAAMEEKHGRLFTQADIEAEEPEYWKLRLARQMSDEYLDRQTGLGTGNIKSLRMALAESPVKESIHQVRDFPDFFNAALTDRTEMLKILNDINDRLFTEMNALGSSSAAASVLPKETESPKPLAADTGASQAAVDRLKQVGIGISELED